MKMPMQGNKIFFEFDPFEIAGTDRPASNVREAKQRIADLVLEEVLNYVGKASSPVSGESWQASLSPAYKKYKAKHSSSTKANMELFGDMLDSLECVVSSNGKIQLRIQGSQAAKADGHNNHSGDSSLPQRRFIPDEGQTFKQDIIEKIKTVLSDYESEETSEDATDGDDGD
jgi:hypothetical protein